MTREEQISIAACAYGAQGSGIDFEAGARWADKHHKSPWISVKESLPYNHEELVDTKLGVTDMVLVITEDNTVKVDNMQLSGRHWVWVETDPDFDGYITHWMPIPKLEE